jgi:hypothetical protein
MGDKKGGGSTMLLDGNPYALDRLGSVLPERIKVIHVTRNPFDNISTIARRNKIDLNDAIRQYFKMCMVNKRLIQPLGSQGIISVRHETLVANCTGVLQGLLAFLGVESTPDYFEACTRTVATSPHRSREQIYWPQSAIQEVLKGIDHCSFLHGYTFQD